MADLKINDLPALLVQNTNDVYEISNNAATLSSKETRAQMLSYTAKNIAVAPYAIGDLIYADTTTTLNKIPDIAVNNVLLSGGVGAAPSYGKVTYNHIQTESASSLLGNPTGAPGAVSEITLGAGLTFVGSTLVSQADVNVTLQDAYNNGDGTIALVAGKPFELNSTTAGFLLPAMTSAQYSAIVTLNNGEMAWDTDLDRVKVNVGTAGSPQIEQVAYLSDVNALTDDSAYGEMTFQGNSTVTTFGATDTPVKVIATYSSGALSGFSHATGTLTYTASPTRAVKVTATLTATFNGSSNNATFYIALNGSIIAKSGQSNFFGGVTPAPQSDPVQVVIPALANGNTLEIWVENNDSTDSIIVQDLNFSVTTIGGISYGGVTIVGEDYLTLAGQEITAHPIDLNSSNVTSDLPFSNIQQISTSRLLGRYDVGTGDIQEIKLGTNLSFTGDTLNVAGDASVTLQDAYNNGDGSIVLANAKPFVLESDTDGVIIDSQRFYNVLSPTVPALIDIEKYTAYDASNVGFDYCTRRTAYYDSTGSASKYGFFWAMYEGGGSNVQNDYFGFDTRYNQIDTFRTMRIAPSENASSVSANPISSAFEVVSTIKGSRPWPSMNQAQRDLILSPATGLAIYDTVINKPSYYNGSAWEAFAVGGTIATAQTPRTDYSASIGSFVSVVTTWAGSNTIPGNSMSIGDMIELSLTGQTSAVTTGGSGVIRCQIGSVTFDTQTFSSTLGGASSTRVWTLNFRITRTGATTAAISASGWVENDSHAMVAMRLYINPTAYTFDFSIDNDMDVLYNMTVGTDAYIFVARNLSIVKYGI